MKNYLLLFSLVLSSFLAAGQNTNVGIGTTAPHASSILDITSTTDGVLIPRMTNAQRIAIGSPALGLMVYQTNTLGANTPGLYFYDGTGWKRFARSDEVGSGGGGWTIVGDHQYSNVAGNVGIGVSTGITEKLFLKGDMLITNIGGPVGNEGNNAELKLHGSSSGLGKVSFWEPDTATLGASIIYSSFSNHFTLRNALNEFGYLRMYQNGHMSFGPPSAVESISKFHITDGDYANLTDHHGYIMLGTQSGNNLVLGNYEILARNNSAASPLYLQHEGGLVRLGSGSVVTGPKLQISDGTEAGLATHGQFVIGEASTANLVMDLDEIQARDNGIANDLYLQQGGGLVRIGSGTGTPSIGARLQLTDGAESSLTGHGLMTLGEISGLNMTMDGTELQARSNGAASNLDLQLDGGSLRVGANNKLFVSTAGNVGIGTGNPLAKLDIAGRLRIVQNGEAIGIDGNDEYIGFWRNGSFRSQLGQYGTKFFMSSFDKIHLNAPQVAIGDVSDAAPDFKLAVNGRIICEELKVEMSVTWPDYVFANDYPLKPLSELKSFIETNHHLPNIPNATTVAKNGIEVGDMNRRLLEKVEELTLYVIQLQEQIDALKVSNRQ